MYCSGLQSAKKKKKEGKKEKAWVRSGEASCILHAGHFYFPFPHLLVWTTVAYLFFFLFFFFSNLLRLMIVVPLTQPPLTYEGHTASLRLFHADKQWEKWCLLQHLQAGVVNSAAWKYCSRLIPQITYIDKVSMQYKRSEPWYWWCTQKPGTQDQLKGQTS